MIESEAELVHQIWLQYANIVDHPLIDVSLEAAAVEHESGGDVELVIPTEASEPVRPGTLDEIDSRRELVFIGDVVGQGQVVARQPPSGDIRSREKFEQLLRNRRHAGGGNHVVRKGWPVSGSRIIVPGTICEKSPVRMATGGRLYTPWVGCAAGSLRDWT